MEGGYTCRCFDYHEKTSVLKIIKLFMKITMFISFRLTTFVLSANINICLNKEEYSVMLHLDNVNIISFGIKKITSSDWLNLVNKSVFFHRMYYFYDSGVSGICRNKEIIEFKPRAFYFVPSNSLIKFNLNTDEHINHFYIDFSTQEISFAEKAFRSLYPSRRRKKLRPPARI